MEEFNISSSTTRVQQGQWEQSSPTAKGESNSNDQPNRGKEVVSALMFMISSPKCSESMSIVVSLRTCARPFSAIGDVFFHLILCFAAPPELRATRSDGKHFYGALKLNYLHALNFHSSAKIGVRHRMRIGLISTVSTLCPRSDTPLLPVRRCTIDATYPLKSRQSRFRATAAGGSMACDGGYDLWGALFAVFLHSLSMHAAKADAKGCHRDRWLSRSHTHAG